MDSSELQLHYEEIKYMYLEQNMSPKEIGENFGVARYKINYILEKNGIQKSVSQAKRKYTINESYFDKIDTANKAYILGFLYADGYNNRINNTIVLSLSELDEDILLKIRDEIGSNKPLYHIDYVNQNDGVDRHLVNMTLASIHMCEALEKLGIHQNKTFDIKFPNFLEETLYSHFIRGYFDGDGCASIYYDTSKDVLRFTTSIMSSLDFCLGMQLFLKTKDINFNVNHPSGKNSANGLIRSSSNKENLKFMKYIYKDADLYMERKYEKFVSYFHNKD